MHVLRDRGSTGTSLFAPVGSSEASWNALRDSVAQYGGLGRFDGR